ncbi:hypothetical protein pkur_cds_279 [Pandoravirus kuranda]|uniref:Uncharacterized protein n=1 Tax=Pandoravirus kuranda TaxID=3019033 RepID=A0AA95EI76_9VIRU|nr:hypothetical protein pkur_cds_279 [Pandoravirus kuranda]
MSMQDKATNTACLMQRSEHGGHRRDPKDARTRGRGLDRPRHDAPWPTLSGVDHAWRVLPATSRHRPPPVGPHYPLSLRDMSRVALDLVPDAPAAVGCPFGDARNTGRTKDVPEGEKANPLATTAQPAPAGETGSLSPMTATVPSFGGTQKRPTRQVPIGTRYALTQREMRECVRIGRERGERNRAEGRASRRFSLHRSDDDISIQGVVGELAFARLFDLSIDVHDTTCRSAHSETRFDAVMMPEGWTVDVKTTVARDGPVRVACWKAPNPPDVYALLVHVNYDPSRALDAAPQSALPIMEFRGFAPAAVVFDAESRVDTTDRDGRPDVIYLVPQARLVDRAALSVEMQRRHNGQQP